MDNGNRSAASAEQLLRHWLATLTFRFEIAVRDAEDDFAGFQAGSGVRTPVELVSHMTSVLLNGYAAMTGTPRHEFEIGGWRDETTRFRDALRMLDRAAAQGLPDRDVLVKVVQGPLSDAMTHIGQLTLLRRLAGHPVQGANYFKAEIGGHLP